MSTLPMVSNTTHLAPLPSNSEWEVMRGIAKAVVASNLFPHLKTEPAALAVILTARELRIPPMFGCNNIHMVQGRPTCGVHVLTAIIQRDHGGTAILFTRTDDEVCTISYRRYDWQQRLEFSYTHQQAAKAGLAGKDNWKAHPAAMLRARCLGAVARMAFADSVAGMFITQEIDPDQPIEASETVNADWPEPTDGQFTIDQDVQAERQADEAPRGPSIGGIQPRPQPTARDLAGKPEPKPAADDLNRERWTVAAAAEDQGFTKASLTLTANVLKAGKFGELSAEAVKRVRDNLGMVATARAAGWALADLMEISEQLLRTPVLALGPAQAAQYRAWVDGALVKRDGAGLWQVMVQAETTA